MTWLVLFGAGLLEVVWAVALKQADGFGRPGWAVLAAVTAVTSVALLSVALRTLPVGTAYSIWTGLGAFGVAVTGMVVLGESVSAARIGFLTLILVGVIGLRFLESA